MHALIALLSLAPAHADGTYDWFVGTPEELAELEASLAFTPDAETFELILMELGDEGSLATELGRVPRNSNETKHCAEVVSMMSHNAWRGLDDTDRDGLADVDERQLFRTGVGSVDTDGDGLPDGIEVAMYDSDPTRAPERFELSYCLAFGANEDGSAYSRTVVFTEDEDAPGDCVFTTTLGAVWDDAALGLSRVYRHTSTDGRASHRLSLDGVSTASELPDAELLFYAESNAQFTSEDHVVGCRSEDTWIYSTDIDWSVGCEETVPLFVLATP